MSALNKSTPPSNLPKPILYLRKALIRPHSIDDAEALAKEANNPTISRWMTNGFPSPYRTEDATSWISTVSTASPIHEFAICRLEDNVIIGCIGLKFRTDIHYRTMEIGYWLSESYWRQGIVTEAVSKFSDWAFEHFEHLVRLEAEVFQGNEASSKVLEKAGFVFESVRRNAIEKSGVVMSASVYCKFRDGF